ncbi:hypothetical protein NHH03_15100 [Stieleria sp. TO1_6]|uniref:toprim domain-containing protein n=1 Tax=Stieleria tagensis TaxID=2956795 RepID=UPI00209B18DE|nr:hypothetical protein [Stieleria tagensis]MCO8123073.1 hypothetical protein [Stieleria tagensis]
MITKPTNKTKSKSTATPQTLASRRRKAGVMIGDSARQAAVKWIAKHARRKCDTLVKEFTSGAPPVVDHSKILRSDPRRTGFAAEGQKNWPCHHCGTESSIYALYGGKGKNSSMDKGQTFKLGGRVYCSKCEESTRNVVETIAMLRGEDQNDPDVIDGVIDGIFESGVIGTPPLLADDIEWDMLKLDPNDLPVYSSQFNLQACAAELNTGVTTAEEIASEMATHSSADPACQSVPIGPSAKPEAAHPTATKKVAKKKVAKKKISAKEIPAGKEKPVIDSLIVQYSKLKGMPPKSLVAFGAAVAKDQHGANEIRVPLWYPEVADLEGIDWAGFDMKGYFRMSLANPRMIGGKIKRHAKHGLFLPGRKPQPNETWYIVEGVKDAAAMHGAGFLNTAGLSTRCFAGPFKSKLPLMFKGCHVILVPDRDNAAAGSVSKNRQDLLDAGASSVKVAVLPFDIVESKGPDTRDCIAKHGKEKLREVIESAGEYDPNDWILTSSNGKSQIGPHSNASEENIKTIFRELGRREEIFVCGDRLVEVYHDSNGKLRFKELTQSVLPGRINEAVDFGPAGVPGWAAPHVHGSSHRAHTFGVRILVRVSSAPILRADGSILRDGYDPELHILVKSSDKYPELPQIDDSPFYTLEPLWKLLDEFPWLDLLQDQAAFLAEVVTLMAPQLFSDRPPLFVHQANVEGAGKSFLASLAHIVAFGSPPRFLAYRKDQDELRKTITSALKSGDTVLILDNADDEIGGATLDAFLTAPVWRDRLLGGNDIIAIHNKATMIITANNATFTPDTLRRTLPVRLNVTDPDYSSREFKVVNLQVEAQRLHCEIYMALLACLQVYIQAGQPQPASRRTLPGFEPWSRFIGGFVEFCGMPSPLLTRETLTKASAVNDTYDLVIAAFESLNLVEGAFGGGMTAMEIFREYEKAETANGVNGAKSGRLSNGKSSDALRELVEAIGSKNGKVTSRTFGAELCKLSKRPRNGHQIQVTEGRAKRFKLVKTN